MMNGSKSRESPRMPFLGHERQILFECFISIIFEPSIQSTSLPLSLLLIHDDYQVIRDEWECDV
jgi:hypothetical protein